MESSPSLWISLARYSGAFVLGMALTFLYHKITHWALRWLLSGHTGWQGRVIQAGFLLLFVFRFGLFFGLAYGLIRWGHLNAVALIAGILVYESYRLLTLLFWPQQYAEN